MEKPDDSELLESARRFEESRSEITAAFQKAQRGQVDKVEPPERIKRYWEREREHWRSEEESGVRDAANEDLGLERVLGMNNDLLSIEFFEQGLIAACAVGMITVADTYHGTGFLVGNGVLLTNHHVIRDEAEAAASVLDMDYETNQYGAPKQMERFTCDPERFFVTDEALDFTLVGVAEQSGSRCSILDFGYHPMIAGEGKILIGRPVNLIQHPRGNTKSIVVHDSRFMFVKNGGELDPYCWYTSDTEPGSSGSPVFNNRWEVVALHHKAVPKRNSRGQWLDRNGKAMSQERAQANPHDVAWEANEGIRTSRLVRAFKEKTLPPAFDEVRRELLALWAKPPEISERAQLASRRRPSPLSPGSVSGRFSRVQEVADAVTRESAREGSRQTIRAESSPTSGPTITINIHIGQG